MNNISRKSKSNAMPRQPHHYPGLRMWAALAVLVAVLASCGADRIHFPTIQANIMTKKAICVVGNPNCGKTTLFNALTGAKQDVQASLPQNDDIQE